MRRNQSLLRDEPGPAWLERYLRNIAKHPTSRTFRRRARLYQAGATDAQVAAQEGLTTEGARLWRLAQLKRSHQRKIPEAEHQRRLAVLLAHTTATDAERARLLGLHTRTFNKWRNQINMHEARVIGVWPRKTVSLLPERAHARLQRLAKKKQITRPG